MLLVNLALPYCLTETISPFCKPMYIGFDKNFKSSRVLRSWVMWWLAPLSNIYEALVVLPVMFRVVRSSLRRFATSKASSIKWLLSTEREILDTVIATLFHQFCYHYRWKSHGLPRQFYHRVLSSICFATTLSVISVSVFSMQCLAVFFLFLCFPQWS